MADCRLNRVCLPGLQAGQLPPANMMPSFQDIQETIGFPEYFAEAARYASDVSPSASGTFSTDASPAGSSQGKLQPAASEKQNPEGGTSRQEASQETGPSPQDAGSRDVEVSWELEAAAEQGQRAVEGRTGMPRAMTEGELSTLDEELQGLDSNGEEPGREASSDTQSTSTTVVEPDAIVLSGSQRGGLVAVSFWHAGMASAVAGWASLQENRCLHCCIHNAALYQSCC